MNPTEIQTQLTELLEEYDALIQDWAEAKADHEKADEMKKLTLNVCKNDAKDAKTEAERERLAYIHPKYMMYLDYAFEKAVTFYIKDAKKKGIEQKIDVLRSLLAWEKQMINLTK